MKAKNLSDLLKKGDRVAMSNITGREASQVSVVSQHYANNIVGGWALGKGGQQTEVAGKEPIPVFATCAELYDSLPKAKRPNKVIIYSPPGAVYGEVKEAIEHGNGRLETLFVITENVSVEVTAKIRALCDETGVDVIGCNTLGVINAHDQVRVGAVGGDTPEEAFHPGGATIISNSGNMVNTIATYMLSSGMGVHFGISTGKDVLILTPLVEFLKLAAASPETKLVLLYVEPGGRYEHDAIAWMRETGFDKPIIVYVAGGLMEGRDIALGHAGSVVEGKETSATGKMAAFDDYFGRPPFEPGERPRKGNGKLEAFRRGVRITTLHHFPAAARTLCRALDWEKDFPVRHQLKLTPWFANYRSLSDVLPGALMLRPGRIPAPYGAQFRRLMKTTVGLSPARRALRNASNASSLDEAGQRIYGYPLTELMGTRSFGEAVILDWTGELPHHPFEARLVEMGLIAALSNGPGTISAQGAKLSASAGNTPNTAMIGTLASIGTVHGGNGRMGVRYLLKTFSPLGIEDPYGKNPNIDVAALAHQTAAKFKTVKDAAKESGVDYERIPCLGHPVFKDAAVNYDPRERAIARAIEEAGKRNIFLDFYHALAGALCDVGVANRVWAVNMDAALATVWLGVCWTALMEKRITVQRVEDCAFLGFALGRAAGGAGEYLDHQDYGTPMDMRVPASECASFTRPRDLPEE
ncbi:hypothetical protein HQ560_02960 [bacterium]|nr:hypothetical protein [bacterium]